MYHSQVPASASVACSYLDIGGGVAVGHVALTIEQNSRLI
jgi:hypothetical protein